MSIQEPIIIRANDLRKLHFCKRKAWLDIHGDLSEHDLPTELQIIRRTGGISHEKDVHTATTDKIHHIALGSWQEGVDATRHAMQQRIRGVIGAILEAEFHLNGLRIIVRGIADRVVARKHDRDVIYAPIEIKQRNKITIADELQLDCYVWLLGQLQGVKPPAEFWMGQGINGYPAQRIRHRYDENRLMQAFELLLQYHLREVDEPEVYIDSRCKECHWFSACKKSATATFDLSLINRLRQDSLDELVSTGILTLNHLIDLEPERLRQIKGIKSMADQFQAQARAWIEDRPIFYRKPSPLCTGHAWHVDTEYYPNHQPNGYVVWSIGWSHSKELSGIILVAEGQSERQLILPEGQQVFIVPRADDAWRLFAEIVGQDDAPIFHWSPADKTALQKAAPKDVVERLVIRFSNLERHFGQSVQLPIYGTSIKDVAKYLGFDWSGHLNWSAAFRDYEKWLQNGDEEALSRTCKYQSDDVTALAVIRRWMIESYSGQYE